MLDSPSKGWGKVGKMTTKPEKQEEEGTGAGDNYVVFPRSIFFWMARAEW